MRQGRTLTRAIANSVVGPGDKNEAGKNPQPTYKKIEKKGKDEPDPSKTEEAIAAAEKMTLKPHPVTGIMVSKEEAMKAQRELEYRKSAGY